MKKVIFPGSFDPFHKGHEQIVNKALKKYDLIYIVISWNEDKTRTYSFEEIYEYLVEKYKTNNKIRIIINKNKMTVNLAQDLECFNLIRGYRNKEDKKYEKKLLNEYKKQDKRIKIYYFHNRNKKLKDIRSSLLKNSDIIK